MGIVVSDCKAILQLKTKPNKQNCHSHGYSLKKKKSYCFVPKGSHTAFNSNCVTKNPERLQRRKEREREEGKRKKERKIRRKREKH